MRGFFVVGSRVGMEIKGKKTPSPRAFRKYIYAWFDRHGRTHLPWRTDPSPYRVLVSEVMLQQTQVDRVIPKFNAWMERFPTLAALGRAPVREVLAAWQGLGYNSRAVRLQKTAQAILDRHAGIVPQIRADLEALPGIGPYTAGAILAFAYNQPEIFIETNIRRVYIHHFFHEQDSVADSTLIPLVAKTLDTQQPARWYAALMDYGSTLPKIVRHNPNRQSKHYVRQTPFTGSVRQVRGAIVRLLLEHNTLYRSQLLSQLKNTEFQPKKGDVETASFVQKFDQALIGLTKEGLVKRAGTRYTLVQ